MHRDEIKWCELTPRCYGFLDILQFNFLRVFSGLPYIGCDPMQEYIGMTKRKEYTSARKIAWVMAANMKEKKISIICG